MKHLFVDTAGWMAMADEGDPFHLESSTARDRFLEEGGILVTSDYVIDETLTLIRRRIQIDAAEKWWNQLSRSSRLRLEWIDPLRAEKAKSWFFKWKDKTFSFTDCTSFVIMQELHIRQVLTTDHHFAVAGFEVLPGSSPKS